VFIDGRELARHEGMWSRQVIEAPAELAGRAEVELAVRIWGSHALPRYAKTWRERLWGLVAGAAQGSFASFDDRLAALKTPMHFGWDFAPRLRAMGIWDDARLVICDGVYIRDVHVQAEPTALPADPGPAVVRLRLALDSHAARLVTVQIGVRPPFDADEPGWQHWVELRLPAGRSEQAFVFELPAMRLWQPWERGEACLYRLDVALEEAGSVRDRTEQLRTHRSVRSPTEPALLDAFTARFGVRRIEMQQTDQGHPWRVVVNGAPFFLRGVNWVPLDALAGRASTERYAALLGQAQAAGVNFVRVWGGGGRERQAFYDLCDELGLLVWQEFPIACVFLDHLPRRPAYLALLRQEAAGMVQALRNHPSIFLWCGGNEWSPARHRPIVRALADAVASGDGTRPFVPASPGRGDAHTWLIWHGRAPLAAYRAEQASMVSEFGLQAAPDVASLRQFLAEAELWPPGAGWQRHNGELAKLARYARWFEDTGVAGPLERFVQASQRAQAAGLQILIEHVRRRRGATGGLAVWQWNEPWPSICWSIVDYFGRPKPALAVMQRSMQPLLVSLDYPLAAYRPGDLLAGMLWVVNDGVETLAGCTLRASLQREGEAAIVLSELPCDAPAQAARPVGKLAIRLPAGFSHLRLELRQGNSLLAHNVYDLRFHDAGPDSLGQAARRRMVDLILR
jgi:beta-mannosidase